MEARHIEAAMRKEHLLGKRQSLATEEVQTRNLSKCETSCFHSALLQGAKKKPRIWLSAEEKVAHAWVAACDAGDYTS